MAKDKWNFDESFMSAYQFAQERKQKETQFKQKLAYEQRQDSLLNMQRQKQYEMELEKQRRDLEGDRLTAESNYSAYPNIESVPEEIRNNAFSGSEFPSLLGSDKFYVPNTEMPKEQKDRLEGSYKNSKTRTYWKYDPDKREGVDTGIPYDPTEGRTTVEINPPKADKWEKFGKLITQVENKYDFDSEGRAVDKSEETRQLQRNEAKNELQTTLLPNAYSFFEKHLDKPVSNEYYLKRVKKGLEDDEITPEEAQDLIDASAYRKRIYGIK